MSKTSKITIGSRTSKLALIQANEVKKLLIKNSNFTEDQIKIVKINTSGDKIQDKSLADIGGKGLFIKELEEQLIAKKIDIAVHSAKDVPPDLDPSTEIAAFSHRKDPHDYFISKNGQNIENLPKNAVLGTSSARRKAILLKIRPDLEIVNFRGNVTTRLEKIAKNEVDATILATCGLQRIGQKIEKSRIIDTEIMLPAVGQGCLAIQAPKNSELRPILRKINHQPSEICVAAERTFLRELKASCKSPIAVFCQIKAEKLHFQGQIFDFDGQNDHKTELFAEIAQKNPEKSHQIAQELAKNAAKKVKDEAGELLLKISAS